MSDKIIFSPGSFFHGTKADLNIGDFLVTGMKKIITMIENQDMFILPEHWMLQSGAQNWQRETVRSGYMLLNQPEILKMTPTLLTINFLVILQNLIEQSSH